MWAGFDVLRGTHGTGTFVPRPGLNNRSDVGNDAERERDVAFPELASLLSSK